MRKTAEERFHTLARGLLAYPVTPRTHIYRRRAVVDVNSWSVRKSNNTNANNSYNRSSAVDSSSKYRPQVGKPTWGYDYTTVLRRLQKHRIAHHHSGNRRRAFLTLARGWIAYPVTPTHAHLPPKSGCRCQLMVGSQIH